MKYSVSSLYLTEDIKEDCELSSMVLRRESGEVFLWMQTLPFREAIKISHKVVGSSKDNASSGLVRLQTMNLGFRYGCCRLRTPVKAIMPLFESLEAAIALGRINCFLD